MKTLIKNRKELQAAGRWDIDFHLPPEHIKKFPKVLLKRVDSVADVAREKRDPTRDPEKSFLYVDISAVDVSVGVITSPQDVEGSEAPSRARKVIRAFDIIVSTCRPTRGAIAVVPPRLHNQIASTAFTILRPGAGVNPFYLHYALRLPSTLEQFRKWSTGSSYPAILDSDVKKTLLPVPDAEIQDAVAARVVGALRERDSALRRANQVWAQTLAQITRSLTGLPEEGIVPEIEGEDEFSDSSLRGVQSVLAELPSLAADNISTEDEDEELQLAQAGTR